MTTFFINYLDSITQKFAEIMWGTPLLILILGGGLFFTFFCRFIPFKYLYHGFQILLGKFDNEKAIGQISHFQALSSALASTVGMGNISGVAIAIHTGGPGALFWMWISAIVGMSTKFFTCTLSILFRSKDDNGDIQGGPMYVIKEGLPKSLHFLAYMFSIAGLFGCLSLFQANQLTQIIQNQVFSPLNLFVDQPFIGQLIVGCSISFIISLVIFGGIKKISKVASQLVPTMVLLYLLCGFIILFKHKNMIDDIFFLIIYDAFTGNAIIGGGIGTVMITGIRRAAFSNEAGIGTESMAHGAAKTNEPIREGLVAMIGPLIDTIIVCSITGFAILVTDVWKNPNYNGITMTSAAFDVGIPFFGEKLFASIRNYQYQKLITILIFFYGVLLLLNPLII